MKIYNISEEVLMFIFGAFMNGENALRYDCSDEEAIRILKKELKKNPNLLSNSTIEDFDTLFYNAL